MPLPRPKQKEITLGRNEKNDYLSASNDRSICRALPSEDSASNTELTKEGLTPVQRRGNITISNCTMKLKLAHVSDLLGLNFNIPYYQRGYRWESKQVVDLLNDLLEFSNRDSKEHQCVGQFYCLQPLVVVLNKTISVESGKDKVYDVIDGQQRLTTLFLIMNKLKLQSYRIRYERSEKSVDNKFESGELLYSDCDPQKSKYDISKYPDYFYLSRAVSDIDSWIKEKKSKYPRIERKIEDVIAPSKYESVSFPEEEKNPDPNDELEDVRFIWYDASTKEEVTYQNSIGIFKRLNYGKTSLTAAELIKALLFQCDIYDSGRKAEMKQVAFRMSTEWDAMEKCLQDKYMWSMIKPAKYEKPSHIDIVLSYVAAKLKESNNISVNVPPNDKDYDYLIFNKYLEADNGSLKKKIEYVWQEIQDVFAIFKSWHEDREYYHLIGAYFTMLNPVDVLSALKEIKVKFESSSRDIFIEWMKKEKIGSLISLKGKKLKGGSATLSLDNIYYGDYSNEIVNILLLHNVRICMEHSQDQQRFPFYFYRDAKFTPSLEHIHPQHLHNEDINFITLCLWYKDKKDGLETIVGTDSETVSLEKVKGAIKVLEEVLILTDEEINDKDNEEAKKSYKEKADFFDKNKNQYIPYLSTIDTYYDELANIDEKELHSISNMALVDKITNTRLGNGLLNAKRFKLQELSNEYDASNGEEGAITFAGTWKVFNKEYSTYARDMKELAKSANLNFWTKLDRTNYLADIKRTYEEYVK